MTTPRRPTRFVPVLAHRTLPGRALGAAAALGLLLAAGPAGAAECSAMPPGGEVPPGFRSATADVGGVAIHYVIGGRGPTVLLVHGWPETWYAWRAVMPALARAHTVIAVDYRGAGESSAPAAGYDRKTMAEDLRGLVAALRLGPVVLVGHDWGAAIAYAYAALHRDEVQGLVAIEGRPEGPWSPAGEPFWFFGFQAIPGFAERVIAGHEAEYLDWFYRTPHFHVVPLEDREVALYECAFARPGRMRAGFELYRTLDQDRRDNAELARRKLSVPVLAIGARRGLGESVAGVMRAVATDVTSVLMEETGHFVPEERPVALAALIEGFLAKEPLPARWTP